MAASVRVAVDDKVGTLALDNVAKRNTLGAGTVAELLQALSEFERRGVRAVVLRTASPVDVWSAGHDIDELPVRGVDPHPFADPLEELLRAVRG
jgi:methylmalonyl-CoA decarboxylase